jgi:hypothetical protein
VASIAYHDSCKPNVPDDQYRTMQSKFAGICAGCKRQILRGEEVALFFDVLIERPPQPVVQVLPAQQEAAPLVPQQVIDRIVSLEQRMQRLEEARKA